MTSKQDRQGARTPADLEYRYGKSFGEILGVAEEAKGTAQEAEKAVAKLDSSLTQDEVFKRLTNNGAWQGLYRDDDGNIYINANYIRAGILIAQEVNAVNQETNEYVIIKNGTLKAGSSETPHFEVYPIPEANGAWAFTFRNWLNDGRTVSGMMSYDQLVLGNDDQEPAPFKVKTTANVGRQSAVEIQLPNTDSHFNADAKMLYAYWRPNGDGSYSIVGYENELEKTT